MNETKKETRTSAQDSAGEVKRLAEIIKENRAALDKGWEELARLTQLLESRHRIEAKDLPPEKPSLAEAASSNAVSSSCVVVVKE